MTLLARRREEPERERAQEAEERRSLAARPPQPRPSFLHLQSAIGNHATGGLLRSGAVVAKLWSEGGRGDLLAQELGPALQLARLLPGGPRDFVVPDGVVPGALTAGHVQASAGPAVEPASREQTTAAPEGKPAEGAPAVRQGEVPRGLIVADDTEPGPGQMAKSAFLEELHTAASAAAEEGLAGIERSAKGCPWIDHYFRLYAGMSVERIEADLLRYVPATRGATIARDYIAPAAEHIRESVSRWAKTGELAGVPEGLPGMGLLRAIGGSLAGIGRMLLEARSGGARDPDHPAAVAARLGPGSALPGGVRSRVEGVFGTALGDVRLHTDATAARLAGRFNARAFTVGPHVAFGAGEYQPGTLVGDTLLAHELAHVAQQGGGGTASTARAETSAELERDADHAAAHVAAGLLRPGRPQKRVRSPRRTALRLQRCGPEKVKGRPGMGLAPPPKASTENYSLGEYIELWQHAAGRTMTTDERKQLALGCVGITLLNLGGSISYAECYHTFDQAKKRADELQAQLGKKPFIFSKRFWSMGKAFPPDPVTGKVDMSADTGQHKSGEVNFDYGWYDEVNNTWWHADHCDPVIAGGSCAESYRSWERMVVAQSTLGHYSDPNYFRADVQVFCVAWSKLQ